MDLQVNNPPVNFSQGPNERSKAQLPSEPNFEQADFDQRQVGEDFASLESQYPLNQSKDIVQEQNSVRALQWVANLGRKIGSRALNVTGFVGFTMAALSYIVFKFKTIAAMFALPSLGAFFIGHSLKKAAKESEAKIGTSTDPVELIKEARDNSLFLEKNFDDVTAAMVKIHEMKDSNPKKLKSFEDLEVVASKVRAKRTELQEIDESNYELLKLDNFMKIYDSIERQVNQDPMMIEIEETD